jgi:hypothetical protein
VTSTQKYLNRFRMMPLIAVAVGVLALNARAWNSNVALAYAQGMNIGQPSTASHGGGHVSFVAEPQTVVANKPATVVLHFHVDPGFHINSHTPKSEMLIPTKIAIEDLPAGNVSTVDFPAGTPYSFAFEPKNKLDVYTGDFNLVAHLTTKPGQQTLKAALHYQACDAAACYPPKLLPVEQPFTAR